MEKPKSSFDDLHNKLIDKNITLDNYSKEQVIDYLKDRSYYYKISSYRKNFPKDSKGKYINLNFVDLTNCASLDVRLRELLLLMCLDVEHSLKTKFMAILTEDEREDGYSIIEEFEDNYTKKFLPKDIDFSYNFENLVYQAFNIGRFGTEDERIEILKNFAKSFILFSSPPKKIIAST